MLGHSTAMARAGHCGRGIEAGRYEAVWHGVNTRGTGVASGVYLYRITSGSGYTDTKRMTLLK